MGRCVYLLAICLTVVGVGSMTALRPALAAERPSFDCTKAGTKTEKAICANANLARLDRAIAAAFRQLKTELEPGDELSEEQAEFLKQRDSCGADAACLAKKMDSRRRELALVPDKSDPRAVFVGRYENSAGSMIVRRTLEGKYELVGSTGDPRGRWACDISGELSVGNKGIVTVEAGEEGESHPVRLTLRGTTLRLTEDEDRRLAGYTCGANGYVEGDYRRVTRLRR